MLNVSDLMTSEVFTLQDSDTLRAARSIMDMARIRHIPIVDDNQKFIGLVTHRDILAATVSRFADIDEVTRDEIETGIPISKIMNCDVTSVAPETTLREAAEILYNNKYGCLPVVDDGRLAGIITEADFLKLTISLMDALENV